MVKEEEEDDNKENKVMVESTEEWLAYATDVVVPMALDKARQVKGFQGRWKTIISKLEQIPTQLSDLSTHPCFFTNTNTPLCKQLLQAISITLNQSLDLADNCCKRKQQQQQQQGKLLMQSHLDALSCQIDFNLRDCALLIKTGILGDLAFSGVENKNILTTNITHLLARLQIGPLEAKHQALDNLLHLMREDESSVFPFLGRSTLSALVHLLTATSPITRDKAVTFICTLTESGTCNTLLVSEGVLPSLIRLLKSGSSVGREKSAIALQRLSVSGEIARSIVGHGGVQPLIEVCFMGDSSTTCTLKNLSVIPELHQTLADEGVVRIMISLLNSEVALASKEYAAECLQNLTSSNEEDIKQSVITEGGIRSLLAYLDTTGLPQEAAIRTVGNLVGCVSVETLISVGLIPRLAHVLKTGSSGAQTAAIRSICGICGESVEVKKLVGESGCIPELVKLLEVKGNEVGEVAAQALASLMTVGCNAREVKQDRRSVPNLVQLLDPSGQNAAKKHAVRCLGVLSGSNSCRKVMISYGAIGYLKKLTEMEDIIGSKKLLESLQTPRAGWYLDPTQARAWGLPHNRAPIIY